MISTEVFLINRENSLLYLLERNKGGDTHIHTHTYRKLMKIKLGIFSSPSDGLWSVDDSDGEGLRSITIYTFSNSFHYFTVCILVAQSHPTHCNPMD